MTDRFGTAPDGQPARLFTLENDRLRVRLTDWGGRMVSVEAPDARGRREHVLLGFDSVEEFAANGGGFGGLLGRFGNRIAGGRFTLDGHAYALERNEGGNTLHGGDSGFHKLRWDVVAADASRLVLAHTSPDGQAGFPGELRVQATYTLEGDTLWLEFDAETTRPTVVNLSVHPYFNLAGPGSLDMMGHELTVPADAYLPTDADQIPTGEIRPVAGTPFDFRSPTAIGARIRANDPQLVHGMGYDHTFALPATAEGAAPRLAARLRDPASGRVLEVLTTQPGLQVYTGNKLHGAFAGHGGLLYRQSAGVAFEPQAFPDAPNHPNFPSAVLRPGERHRPRSGYRFTTG